MSDLTSFARDTERRVEQPGFEQIVTRYRRHRRRRYALGSAAAVLAVLAVVLAASGVGRPTAQRLPSAPTPQLTSVAVPEWTADQIVGHPDAFVASQLESRADRRTVLTVWKRCEVPTPDHDCLGREAMAVVDGTDHRFLVLGAVTGSSNQPDLRDPGVLREVGDGVWYWAHRSPGPYLLSPIMRQPVQLTVMDRPVAPLYGTPTVECADGIGLCALDVNARTLQRLALPQVDGIRWATPTSAGCGIWGLAGAGADRRLVIQQSDGSFATASLPQTSRGISMAEGGPACEVAVYQDVSDTRTEIVVSVDNGATWQVRGPVLPPAQQDGLIEERPRLRVLLSPRWAALPTTRGTYPAPGPLTPL
ncbi:MAG TPA: hypothetical protein VFL38_09565 [Humibacillus xanthopallidus]|nr:hypothetical protein [Humibacillus xanthopallidus]